MIASCHGNQEMGRVHERDLKARRISKKQNEEEVKRKQFLCSSWCPDDEILPLLLLLLALLVMLRPMLLLLLLLLRSCGSRLALRMSERLADGTDVRSVNGSSLRDLVGVDVLVVDEDVDELPGSVAARRIVALADVVAPVGRRSQQGGPVVQLTTATDFILPQGRHWIPSKLNS